MFNLLNCLVIMETIKRLGDVDSLDLWNGVRVQASVAMLPLIAEKTMDALVCGNKSALSSVAEGGGIQSYCAKLAVSYADALLDALKGV